MEEPIQYNLDTGFIWVVIRRQPIDGAPADWHIQALATHEHLAIAMCYDKTYMIGPLPLNSSLPHETIEWLGSYFPLA